MVKEKSSSSNDTPLPASKRVEYVKMKNPRWNTKNYDYRAVLRGEVRRSERLRDKNPTQFVLFRQQSAAAAKPKKPPRVQKIFIPPPDLLDPITRERFYPTKPPPPPLTPEERAKRLQEFLARPVPPYPDPEKNKGGSGRPIGFDDYYSCYQITDLPHVPSSPPPYPLLLRINEATAAIAGYPPRGDPPPVGAPSDSELTREEREEQFQKMMKEKFGHLMIKGGDK